MTHPQVKPFHLDLASWKRYENSLFFFRCARACPAVTAFSSQKRADFFSYKWHAFVKMSQRHGTNVPLFFLFLFKPCIFIPDREN